MAKYFFIGIGGIGMSALAELLKSQGHVVRGSDVADSSTVQRLLSLGISVQIGHGLGVNFLDPGLRREDASTPSLGREDASTPSLGREDASTPSLRREDASTPSLRREDASTCTPGREENSGLCGSGFCGEDESFFELEEIIVLNSAISSQNPLWLYAKKMGCKVLKRGELLAEFVNKNHGLVVAGSHGKTTTSSMLAHILKFAGKNPSFAIGGRLVDSGCNAQLGLDLNTQNLFVAEGDESDASFLKLFPKILGVTNLDADHMSTYGHNFQKLIQSFVGWIQNLPAGGVAVLNVENLGVLKVLEQLEKSNPDFWNNKKLIKIGKNFPPQKTDILLEAIQQEAQIIRVNFWVSSDFFHPSCQSHQSFHSGHSGHYDHYEARWPLIGEFNAMNALMAGAMANAVGVSWPEINQALQAYPGVQRRMQFLGKFQEALFFEDYGHHPTEIQASLLGLKKAYPNARLIQVFQPHRYTRTQDLWDDFLEVLSLSNILILLPIYPASEAEIFGITSEALLTEIPAHASKVFEYVQDLDSAFSMLLRNIQPGDLVVLQGAGDIPEKLGRKIFS
jgi:UDP-N-acetylmuramate--alanine ligase